MNSSDSIAKRSIRILRDALDVEDGEERDAFVREHCGTDAALFARVASLLRGIGEGEHGSLGEPSTSDPLVGTRLGPFRVAERVGRGGMGVVYRGLREGEDFAQEVALKVIRRGFDFDDVHARFLRERRILARLSHPNLARFVDGGIAPGGRPWFALDYVDGEAITRWCDTRRLDLRARIRRFLDVCAAVQYAHGQLVVHRDLKPGNVLVDRTGAVRLLDFGIARLLGGDEIAEMGLTTVGSRPALTPEYAAPEQFGGEPAGVATDVYALAVIAYELVTGVLPYEIDRRDPAAAERTVRTQPPQALVAAIARGGAPGTQARLRSRCTTLRAYRALVRGDLSRILDKALAKEPARRYAGVQAFADDLARWLDGTPVRVSGNGLRYRLGKFVRRNQVAVGIAAVALLATIVGVSGTLWQAREAAASASRAQAQATRATAARDFLASLLGQASPEQSRGEDTTVREVLERARARIGSELAAQPELRVEMSTLIGSVYNDLASYDEAESLLADAIVIADRDTGIAPLIRARVHSTYASVLLARNAGAEAEAEATLAIDLLRAQPPGTDLAASLNHLATAQYLQQEYEEALRAQREATALLASIDGADSESHASGQMELGYFLSASGKAAEAVDASRHALAIVDRLYPQGRQPIVTRALWALGYTLSSADRDAEAVPHLERARDEVAAIYGRDSLKYMRSLQLLGVSELETGAVQSARDHLADAERLLLAQAPEHPLLDALLGYRGESLLRNGEFAAAVDVLERAVEHARAGGKSDLMQHSTILLARARLGQGEVAKAVQGLDPCLAELRASGSRRLASALIVRAAAARLQGDWDEANARLSEAQPLIDSANRTTKIAQALEQSRLAAAIGDAPARRRHAERARGLLLEAGARAAPEFAEADRLATQRG